MTLHDIEQLLRRRLAKALIDHPDAHRCRVQIWLGELGEENLEEPTATGIGATIGEAFQRAAMALDQAPEARR